MPAPPAGLVTAVRNGTVARHTLLRMTHSGGTVLAWDGVGELLFGGEVYLGAVGPARVQGLGEARDLQNNTVTVALNGVATPALAITDPSVKGQAATITHVWLDETGAAVASRVAFAGFGDTLEMLPNGETSALVLTLRSPVADWSDVPSRYYAPTDQERIFAGDTGFSQTPGLQNKVVTGWGPTPEGSGGYMLGYSNPSIGALYAARDSLTGTLIGSGTKGHVLFTGPTGGASSFWRVFDAAGNIWQATEQTSTTLIGKDVPGYASTAAGRCPIDVNGAVQTAGGSFIEMYTTGGVAGGGSSNLRTILPTPPAATGPTATTVQLGTAPIADRYKLTGFTVAGNFYHPAVIIDNALGYCVRHSVGTGPYLTRDDGTTAFYVEEGTGTAVTCANAAGSLMKVGAGNCILDASGLILSPTNKRLIISGSPENHLRIWK